MSRKIKISLYAIGIILASLVGGVFIVLTPITMLISFVLGYFLGVEIVK